MVALTDRYHSQGVFFFWGGGGGGGEAQWDYFLVFTMIGGSTGIYWGKVPKMLGIWKCNKELTVQHPNKIFQISYQTVK